MQKTAERGKAQNALKLPVQDNIRLHTSLYIILVIALVLKPGNYIKNKFPETKEFIFLF